MTATSLMSNVGGSGVAKRFLSTCKTMLSVATPRLDAIQEAALDQDQCILVNERDEAVGSASKRLCHQVSPDGTIPLHRAFSLFLFNSGGEMLMQKRGAKKVTFPGVYTNACCSHPLWVNDTEEPIVKAVQRRLTHELGIAPEQMSDEDFTLLTRIHYFHSGDGKWGEHEMDYIFFLQKDVELSPNPEEVDRVLYIPKDKLEESIAKFDAPISPWFKLVLKHRLKFWWDNIHQLQYCQDNAIHHMS